MTTPPADSESLGFAALGLSAPLVAAVTALGYEEATPIQREAIPVLISGRDLVGQAGTGTGKTAAFALPLIHRLAESAGQTAGSGNARGMVLVPTRELAMQVAEAIHKYSKGQKFTVVPLYGGAPMDQQIRALRRGAGIVVATPGRALDHLRRQTLDLSGAKDVQGVTVVVPAAVRGDELRELCGRFPIRREKRRPRRIPITEHE